MKSPWQIRRYCAVFNEWSCELDGDEPLRERIRAGAFLLLRHPITANIQHCSAPVATTWDKSLRLWMDPHGLAIEMVLPATPAGVGLLNMVSNGINAMSFGLINLQSHYFRDEDGLCREVTRCDLDHVSIVEGGAYKSACCWFSGTPADRMTPEVAAASRRWQLGRIAHAIKRNSLRSARPLVMRE
jgi:HK97 family phage prohead protease